MSNNNYSPSAGRNFFTDSYYQAASVGPFNAKFTDGSFAAYCTFILRGDIQDPTANMAEQFLWGNLDVVNNAGWAISLIVGSGNTLNLAARVGQGGDIDNAFVPIAAEAGLSVYTPIERLVMAGLWFDAVSNTLLLTVNGVVAAYVASGVADPSALPARMGAGNGAIPAQQATFVDIVSVGYHNENDFPQGGAGAYAGSAFSAARETFCSNYLVPAAGLDWTHRYDFSVATSDATITRTTAGAVVSQPSVTPASLLDLGGRGPANPNRATNVAVPLTRFGTNVHLFTRRNADWFLGAAFPTAQPQ